MDARTRRTYNDCFGIEPPEESEQTMGIKYYGNNCFEITRPAGRPDHEGDIDATFEATADSFEIDLSQNRGRDRDNYQSYWDVGIKLQEDEARELLLLLTVWLEQRP